MHDQATVDHILASRHKGGVLLEEEQRYGSSLLSRADTWKRQARSHI